MNESSADNPLSVLKHHEDNEQYRASFYKDVTTLYQAMPCNPFEVESFCALNNAFHESVLHNLKKLLTKGEEDVKYFLSDRLIMQKIPITEKISKNNFPLLNQISSQSSSLNFGAPLMNKLRSAIEHRPSLADSLFTEELYGVPPLYHVIKAQLRIDFNFLLHQSILQQLLKL